MSKTIRIGTRASKLAQWQANYIADRIRAQYEDMKVEIRTFTTRGDVEIEKALPSIGGKGVFTAELESALQTGEIDCAVHSLKDLPVEEISGITIGAIPERADASDALVSRDGKTLKNLPMGAVVGTSSLRRKAQLLYQRPDLQIKDIRGNVPTRIEKLMAKDSPYSAIVLATAGLERLDMASTIVEKLSSPIMLNAPAQGAIGVQCRDEPDSLSMLAPLMDMQTWLAVTAERAFLLALGGGCALPVSAYAWIERSVLNLLGRVTAADGSKQIDIEGKIGLIRESNIVASSHRLGIDVAQKAIDEGAKELLAQSGV